MNPILVLTGLSSKVGTLSMHDNELIVKAQNDCRVLRLIPRDKLQGDFPDGSISTCVY